jgi:hypothetical protein
LVVKSLLDPDFRYVPAARTDLRRTFARIRKELAGGEGARAGARGAHRKARGEEMSEWHTGVSQQLPGQDSGCEHDDMLFTHCLACERDRLYARIAELEREQDELLRENRALREVLRESYEAMREPTGPWHDERCNKAMQTARVLLAAPQEPAQEGKG